MPLDKRLRATASWRWSPALRWGRLPALPVVRAACKNTHRGPRGPTLPRSTLLTTGGQEPEAASWLTAAAHSHWPCQDIAGCSWPRRAMEEDLEQQKAGSEERRAQLDAWMKRLETEEATLKFRQTPSSIRHAGVPPLSALTARGLELSRLACPQGLACLRTSLSPNSTALALDPAAAPRSATSTPSSTARPRRKMNDMLKEEEER